MHADPFLSDSLIPSFLSGGERPDQFLFYSGFDVWHFGYAAYSGLQIAPAGLNNDGFIVRIASSEDIERYDTPFATLRTWITRGAVMGGWRVKRGDLEIRVFGGINFENDRLTVNVLGATLRGSAWGAQIGTELWWEPTPRLMVSAAFSTTTIAHGYTARIATGWRLFDQFWIGPEIAASSDIASQQYRAGIQITGYKAWGLEWSSGIGFVEDSFRRSGAYMRTGMLIRY